MNKFDENPISAKDAAAALGIATSTLSAIRRTLGVKTHKWFLSEYRRFLRENPQWSTQQVYHRAKCDCAPCAERRAAKALARETRKSEQLLSNPPGVTENAVSYRVPTTAKHAEGLSLATSLPSSVRGKRVRGDLGAKLRTLRGDRSADDIATIAQTSRESIFRIERGSPVKIDTVRNIAGALQASRAEMLDLTVAWIRQTIGDDADALHIAVKQPGEIRYEPHFEIQVQRAQKLMSYLSIQEREQLMVAMQSREMMKCLGIMVSLAGIDFRIEKLVKNTKAVSA